MSRHINTECIGMQVQQNRAPPRPPPQSRGMRVEMAAARAARAAIAVHLHDGPLHGHDSAAAATSSCRARPACLGSIASNVCCPPRGACSSTSSSEDKSICHSHRTPRRKLINIKKSRGESQGRWGWGHTSFSDSESAEKSSPTVPRPPPLSPWSPFISSSATPSLLISN